MRGPRKEAGGLLALACMPLATNLDETLERRRNGQVVLDLEDLSTLLLCSTVLHAVGHCHITD